MKSWWPRGRWEGQEAASACRGTKDNEGRRAGKGRVPRWEVRGQPPGAEASPGERGSASLERRRADLRSTPCAVAGHLAPGKSSLLLRAACCCLHPGAGADAGAPSVHLAPTCGLQGKHLPRRRRSVPPSHKGGSPSCSRATSHAPGPRFLN